MILTPMSITLGAILLVLGSAYAYFAYRYARYSPWNATWQGITLEAQKITYAGLVVFFLIDTFIPQYWPGRYSLLLILLVLLTVEAWATLLGLLHVQRRRTKATETHKEPKIDPELVENPQPDIDRLQ